MPLATLQIQLIRSGASDEHPFTQPVLTLGRANDNAIVLQDPQVSGHHLRIEHIPSNGQFTLTDLRSRNGTRVNGQPILPMTPTPLRLGDAIELIEFRLTLRPYDPNGIPAIAERVRIAVQTQPGFVVFLSEKGQVSKTALSKPVTTLGRAKENDMVVEHPMVSRHHAQVTQSPDGSFVITDQNSANGLKFDGQRVPRKELADGDLLTIGDHHEVALQFRASIGFLPAPQPQAQPEPGPQPESEPQAGLLDLKGMESISIGRAADNRIVLDHPQVSRHHALIERMGTRYRIRDLKSGNGVFVNGARVGREAWLKEGDDIRIGPRKLVLRQDGLEHLAEEGLRLDVLQLNKWITRDRNLLQNISLSILPQEFVALVGMSGSGKSTLMDAINGSRPATHGAVYVNGVDLYHNMDLFRNDMGYVPQKDIIHTELTVYQALDYSAQLRMPADTSPADRHQRILQVLNDLDLDERQGAPISKLSGGQVKRVSIGVELLTQPRLFFLDEPTSGLDPGNEFEMMRLLRKLADQGRTILLVTHATKNVMMCDKVIFLARGGYVAYYGPPEEALPYFDQYRSPEEQRLKDIEFDDIYRLLSDEKYGDAKTWSARYLQSRQYQEHVMGRLRDRPAGSAETSRVSPTKPRRIRRPTSSLRQAMILSGRNLQTILRDRASLAMTLALAPAIGLMDFIWGGRLFDVEQGDAGKAITMLFMAALISLLVGVLSSVREIVKEMDIYRRERAVNLRIAPYILSKLWIGVMLALYQSAVLMALKLILVHPPLSGLGLGAFFFTLVLGNLSGYALGLLISAVAPNQNVALLLVLVVIVPQFLFTGALLPLNLIPGGEAISAAMPTRWGFEALVNITGIGRDVTGDTCWAMPARERDNLTEEQKRKFGCPCMGTAMFETCNFPGLRQVYDAETRNALAAPMPAEPLEPTPYPTLTPMPAVNDPQKQMLEYAQLREKQAQEFKEQMRAYGDQRAEWEKKRGKAIATSEGIIKAIVDNYGRAFKGGVTERWSSMAALMVVALALVMIFQKRKDVA